MVLYCGLLAVVYREMNLKTLYELLADTMKGSATILFLIASSPQPRPGKYRSDNRP